ncbi:copper homeostasis protein CutC [candidate division KSB3 bacterium]|uniref:PF03932 family protein CutC n=1 Tax=candidate division KSB3 bacterium TaxID=2044937 RepID=A0A2G6E2J0_9BACT|nr:MAG: copper homeostasis protein CutC [candidate division KSB3 bacterium]PIE28582.1 MAG: copper homeostasis protein CutC [candidate division KSB3 bacterium]
MDTLTIEVCLDSIHSAVEAQKGGADRVELCDNLFEGGTTPSAGMIATVRKKIDIGLQVIIRPRGGDFCYSDDEYDSMTFDIETAKNLGADGVVIGILTPDGRVDIERCARLVEAARPMNVTFHRAFDVCRDPWEGLEDVISTGADRILTSGQEATVPEGLDTIAELVKRAGERIIIMPGCGITERNMEKVRRRSGAKEFHVLIDRHDDSAMTYRVKHIYMGGILHLPEYSRSITDAAAIKQIRG